MEDGVDLEAYFERLGYAGPRDPTVETLRALHLAHPSAIPFEGLDPLLGRPVQIDAASIEAKLVRGRRGGYCFEQNGLFLRVLTALGYAVTPLAARVRWMVPEEAPPTALTHMLLRLDVEGADLICDVGFGGQSPSAPLKLEPGVAQTTPHGDYRILQVEEGFDMQLRLSERWATLYRFTLEPRAFADYEVGNWFTSTHPQSRFTTNLIASRLSGEQRLNLFNTELSVHHRDGGPRRRILTDPPALHGVLTNDFGLDIPLHDIEQVFPKLPAPVQPLPAGNK